MNQHISVVIPVYNESANIPILVEQLADVFAAVPPAKLECIIVNDGSTDDTRALLAGLRTKYDWLRPVHMAHNSGQSAALLAGMRLATGNVLITLDGDLQNDPQDIPRLLAALEQYDCVCGYREKRNDPWHRRLTSWLGNRVRRRIVDDGIRDAGCGIKGFRRECITHFIPFNGVHRFFAAMARNGGMSVTEIPVSHHPRTHGHSKYGFGNRLFWVLYDFVGVAWLRRRYICIDVEKEPLVVCEQPALTAPTEEEPPVIAPFTPSAKGH